MLKAYLILCNYRLQKQVGDHQGRQGLAKAFGRFEGTQHKQVFHIHRDLVVKLLAWVCVVGLIADVGLAGSLSLRVAKCFLRGLSHYRMHAAG